MQVKFDRLERQERKASLSIHPKYLSSFEVRRAHPPTRPVRACVRVPEHSRSELNRICHTVQSQQERIEQLESELRASAASLRKSTRPVLHPASFRRAPLWFFSPMHTRQCVRRLWMCVACVQPHASAHQNPLEVQAALLDCVSGRMLSRRCRTQC
jgi:hypothetical protein